MTADDIRAHRNANPFRPFNIEMNDGRSIFVELPMRMTISREGGTMTVFEGDDLSILKVRDIMEIRPCQEAEIGNP